MSEKKIIGKECKFVIHIPSRSSDVPDYHMVKERIHYEDGSQEPKVSWVKDFKRPFWVTKPNKRNHEQNKEWEHLDNLLRRDCTESNLRYEVAKALDKGWSKDQLNILSRSPYLYGSDISSSVFLKYQYQAKNPDLISAYTVANFDIETDVINGTEEPIMASLVFKEKAYIAVTEDYVKGIVNPEEQFRIRARKYIGEYIDKHNLQIEFVVVKNTVEVISTTIAKAHAWQPDFLAIWNMNFDIPKCLATLEKYEVDPKTVFCDPRVPEHLRICKYRKGVDMKKTASGKVKPLNPAMQWHTLELTASFYVIDAMCSYKHLRMSKQEEPSYALDAILNKELKIGKLDFKEAEGYVKLKWHQFMQTNYKLEYCVYNVFDSLAMQELDLKTKDLSSSLPAGSGASEFSDFKSQPKRIIDAFFFYCLLEKNFVLGTVGKREIVKIEDTYEVDLEDTDDDYDTVPEVEDSFMEKDSALSLGGWVVTLPAHLAVLGMNVIREESTLLSTIRAFVYDSDKYVTLSL